MLHLKLKTINAEQTQNETNLKDLLNVKKMFFLFKESKLQCYAIL